MSPTIISYGELKSNIPLTEIRNVRKYELNDTGFDRVFHNLSSFDREIMNMREAPSSAFQEQRVTIHDYQALENRKFKISLINHSEKFRICVEEIFSSSKHITRIEKRRLPICLKSSTKYPFDFIIHIT